MYSIVIQISNTTRLKTPAVGCRENRAKSVGLGFLDESEQSLAPTEALRALDDFVLVGVHCYAELKARHERSVEQN